MEKLLENFNLNKYSVIPLDGKRPIQKGWDKHCIEKQTYSDIQTHTGNFGITTGPASGLLVLDVDDIKSFEATCIENGWDLPETLTVRTGSGGIHYYFQYPTDGQQYLNRSRQKQGFDIRGIGGQVVAPGSIHPETDKLYVVEKDLPTAAAPLWMLNISKGVNLPITSDNTLKQKAPIPLKEVNLDAIQLNDTTRQLILDGSEKPHRSEAIWSVLMALIPAGLSDGEILYLFDQYPIGDKSREFNDPAQWLLPQIQKARSVAEAEIITSQEISYSLELSERGDSILFAKLASGNFCYDHSTKKWCRFNGVTWEEDTKTQVLSHLDKLVHLYMDEAGRLSDEKRKAIKEENHEKEKQYRKQENELYYRSKRLNTLQRRKNVLQLAAGELGITSDDWDSNPWIFPCANGAIDLKTGQLLPVNPEDYIKTASKVKWTGLDTPAPTWEKFLNDIFQNDQELISYIQRLFGCGLIGQVLEHVLPIFWGKGRNGKSTLFNVLKLVLGDLASPIPSETILSQKFTQSGASHNADLFLFKGRRMVWTSEVGDNRYFDSSTVKRLTGGDELVGRKPHAADFEFITPSHMLFLLTNAKPRIHNADDYALFRRLHLIPFKASFVPEPKEKFELQADPQMETKLKEEASGILAWFVRGCLSYQEQGLNPPAIVHEATKEYQQEEDSFGYFLDEHCKERSGSRVDRSILYNTYKKWCSENGHHPLNSKNFYKKMRERYGKEKKSGNSRFFVGLCLVEAHVQESPAASSDDF